MNTPPAASACSRRQFVSQLAHGALALGAAHTAGSTALAAAANPFAYDVDRFARTDPALLGWEEVSRRSAPLKESRRLAIGPGDVVHVAAGNEIVRWSPTGALPAVDLGASVTCLAVAPDGTLFAGLRRRIVSLDTGGQPRTVWESDNPRAWFTGLAMAENDLWVADSGQRIVWHCDRAGKLLGRIGGREPERNIPGFSVPSPFLDVRLHPDGLLRINNPGRHRVEAYTAGGDLELAWGRPSAGIAGFCGCCNPIALALLPGGRTVTCEKGLPRVKVYGADGTLESVVAGTESFSENHRKAAAADGSARAGLDVAVDSQARIHILDRATGEVRVMRLKSLS
jgi:hypothetical protein